MDYRGRDLPLCCRHRDRADPEDHPFAGSRPVCLTAARAHGGNTTRMTAAVNAGKWDVATIAGSIMLIFLIGVAVGALISQLGQRYLPPTRTREAILLFICLTSTVASGLVAGGVDKLAVYVLSFTVGAMNSTFERGGEVSISLTYMTGTLVKMSQRFVGAFFGGLRAVWVVNVMLVAATAAALVNRQRRRDRGLPV
ncbi:DUF1275 family protein [Corynebacterium genitalium]|uniref:DUF1275 family protein n=1 Tax=Corynebacterium genitalium TaxID=38288 RepID=UPI0022B3CDD5|nr:YoaK family protein [Corynebacterium genitalium]